MFQPCLPAAPARVRHVASSGLEPADGEVRWGRDDGCKRRGGSRQESPHGCDGGGAGPEGRCVRCTELWEALWGCGWMQPWHRSVPKQWGFTLVVAHGFWWGAARPRYVCPQSLTQEAAQGQLQVLMQASKPPNPCWTVLAEHARGENTRGQSGALNPWCLSRYLARVSSSTFLMNFFPFKSIMKITMFIRAKVIC